MEDYLIFISKNPAEPWAIYCPQQRKLFTAIWVGVRVPSETIWRAWEYVKQHYNQDMSEITGVSPVYVVKASGILVFDGLNALIIPDKTRVWVERTITLL